MQHYKSLHVVVITCTTRLNISLHFVYAAVTLIHASFSASRSSCNPPSNFVSGYVDNMVHGLLVAAHAYIHTIKI